MPATPCSPRFPTTGSRPEPPVERAVLDRLGDALGADRVGSGEVGNRAGDLENPLVGARAGSPDNWGLNRWAR